MTASIFGKVALKKLESDINKEIEIGITSFKTAFRVSNGSSNYNMERSLSQINGYADNSNRMGFNRNFSANSFLDSENSCSHPINWYNFNYPPLLKIVHFNLNELPSHVAYVCKFLHYTFLSIFGILCINFVHTCILAIGGLPPIWICYSILNFLILTPLAGYTFYKGYKGIVISSPCHINRYILCHIILFIIATYFALSPLANSNGLIKFCVFEEESVLFKISATMKYFWMYVVILESFLWMVAIVIGAYGMYLVHTFNPYNSQQHRTGGQIF